MWVINRERLKRVIGWDIKKVIKKLLLKKIHKRDENWLKIVKKWKNSKKSLKFNKISSQHFKRIKETLKTIKAIKTHQNYSNQHREISLFTRKNSNFFSHKFTIKIPPIKTVCVVTFMDLHAWVYSHNKSEKIWILRRATGSVNWVWN